MEKSKLLEKAPPVFSNHIDEFKLPEEVIKYFEIILTEYPPATLNYIITDEVLYNLMEYLTKKIWFRCNAYISLLNDGVDSQYESEIEHYKNRIWANETHIFNLLKRYKSISVLWILRGRSEIFTNGMEDRILKKLTTENNPNKNNNKEKFNALINERNKMIESYSLRAKRNK